jgi:restriction endonuclease Mrr
MRRLGQGNLSDSAVRKKFRTAIRRRLLQAALDEVARRQVSTRATQQQIRARGEQIKRHLQRAGLLKLVGGSVPLLGA